VSLVLIVPLSLPTRAVTWRVGACTWLAYALLRAGEQRKLRRLSERSAN